MVLTSQPCYLFHICRWGTSWWPLVKVGWSMRDIPGSRTLCLMTTKEGCLTPPGTLKIWQTVEDLRRRKVWYIMPVPDRFLENMGTHIFFLKRVPHTTWQLSALWKNWAPSMDFFMGITPSWPQIPHVFGNKDWINVFHGVSTVVTCPSCKAMWALDVNSSCRLWVRTPRSPLMWFFAQMAWYRHRSKF